MTGEPYVVRKLRIEHAIALVVLMGVIVLFGGPDSGVPPVVLAGIGVFAVVCTAIGLERLRIDEKGIRVLPAARIPWDQLARVTAPNPQQLVLEFKPEVPLPRGVTDRTVVLPARGFELDQARLDQAVRAYADAGGSSSGMPGSGASSSSMSAGGPSG